MAVKSCAFFVAISNKTYKYANGVVCVLFLR